MRSRHHKTQVGAMRARQKGLAALATTGVLVAALVAAVGVSTATAGKGGNGRAPEKVVSKTETAKQKLHTRLAEKLESGATEKVAVLVTVAGDPARARTIMDESLVSSSEDVGGKGSLILGKIGAQKLAKLATLDGVVSVKPVEFRKTGSPAGRDPEGGNRAPDTKKLQGALAGLVKKDVPYSKAPAPKQSDLADLTSRNVLDAKTHDFYNAWKQGFMGQGSTVAVLDGGTDFAHPDLLNTWQVWPTPAPTSGTIDQGWAGWPRAFDPYGTLQLALAPDLVDGGLSWYTPTASHDLGCGESSKKDVKDGICREKFGVRTGPSRNFSAPDGFNEHTYSFPRTWSKSGTVKFSSHPDDYMLGTIGERLGVLVTDPNTAGSYDTVFVDLDADHDFSDEKPVTKSSPASYRDMDGDGVIDISGGLLYYISDGNTRIPGGITSFGDTTMPAAGSLLAWTGDFDPAIAGHGTLTASNVVGQGVVRGLAPSFSDLPAHKYPGVLGGAPKAKLAPYGDVYFSIEASSQVGYFLANIGSRGIDVTSNSYGYSDVDNDGWDSASQEAALIHTLVGNRTLGVASTGNGAPGFGTTSPPSPPMWLSVGASTQFGGTGWDSITSTSQIVDNDVMVWSNRGPGATGANGVDVVADGAFSPGDVTLNAVLDGNTAWETWGGTSRSTPVAAGAAALVYQAYRQSHPGPVPANFQYAAKAILKSSANDLGYDTFTQGSGSIDAARAVALASAGGFAFPDEWKPGDYRGTDYELFSNLIPPGGSDSQEFQLPGAGTYAISDRYLVESHTETIDLASSDVSQESQYNFNAPDYLHDLTPLIEAHGQDADLMVVRANYPYGSFDGDGNYEADQAWRLLTYSWTDVNGNGRLWKDTDGNGAVAHANLPKSTNIDGNADLRLGQELDAGEYVRFMYHRAGANTLQSWVRDPYARMKDGVFLGFQHPTRNAAIPVTPFKVEVTFYKNVDWPWLTVPASASGSFNASISVPAGTPYGLYEGAIVASKDGNDTVIPVTTNVAATLPQDEDGNVTGALTFGGTDVAAAQSNRLYNNGSVFGATDWTWRPESGDWRFFFFDVPKEPAAGSLLLADTTWAGAQGTHTDLDTILFGPSGVSFTGFFFDDLPYEGDYALDTIAKSQNRNVGAGVWQFGTVTDGPREVVAAPIVDEGLHAIVQHQVLFEGDQFDVPFTTTIGSASVSPTAYETETEETTGSFDVTFTSSVSLNGLVADGFGLSQPDVLDRTAKQDDPNDPSSAGVKETRTITHASKAVFSTDLAGGDVDLFVVLDQNGDGQFTNSEIVGSSAGGTGIEEVTLIAPPDGSYQVWVQGWAVTGTPAFHLGIDIVQGTDLTITGVPAGDVPAGTPVTLTVDFDKADMADGETYFGQVLLGPDVAPTAITIDVEITKVGVAPVPGGAAAGAGAGGATGSPAATPPASQPAAGGAAAAPGNGNGNGKANGKK